MPEIWAHYQLPAEVSSFFLTSYGAKVRRSARQFGTDIPESRRINSGLGIALRYDSHGFLPPSKLAIEKETYAKIAGIPFSISPHNTFFFISKFVKNKYAFFSSFWFRCLF